MEQLFEAMQPKTGSFGFGSRTVLGSSQATYSFCPHSVAVGSTQPPTQTSTKERPCG